MPFGIQPIHLIIIGVTALLIFGPSRLPEIGRGVGKALTEFRQSFREMNASIIEEANKTEEGRVISDPLTANGIKPTSFAANICPRCGATNPNQTHHCSSCGAKLAE